MRVRSVVAHCLTMVEGHSVHRVASLHRQRLVGKAFKAWSPNGRFKEGAKAIDGKRFASIEAVGKNLFAFFGDDAKDPQQHVVVHVHFGMSGNWACYDTAKKKGKPEQVPEPRATNRLRLEGHGLVADLSAMTVQHGDYSLYTSKREKLGEDPLRDDANPEKLWSRVEKSNKSIGNLIMDQSYFTGPGNIYRAEILFKAGVHPDKAGKSLTKHEFDRIWHHTVALLQRGYQTGSILTVDAEEARALGNPKLRRYIYNRSTCPRCHSAIKTWQIANRTCYACPKCQPRPVAKDEPLSPVSPTPSLARSKVVSPEQEQDCVPFNSHCAPDSADVRLRERGAAGLTVAEIKEELGRRNVTEIPPKAKKADLVQLLEAAIQKNQAEKSKPLLSNMTVKQIKAELDHLNVTDIPAKAKKADLLELLKKARAAEEATEAADHLKEQPAATTSMTTPPRGVSTRTSPSVKAALFVSPEDAAVEKAQAGESLAVEHIAELAPGQARSARAKATSDGDGGGQIRGKKRKATASGPGPRKASRSRPNAKRS